MESIIEFEEVIISQHAKIVLTDVQLHIGTGEFCYVIGKSGSGKSSLLKSIYGELEITRGRAIALGVDLTQINRKHLPQLRQQMGMVFQSFMLFNNKTVRGNLAIVLRATGWEEDALIETRIDEVLAQVGLENHKEKYPLELSGGEQQRIALARAILNKPKLIIADEPTGNLDPKTSDEVLYLLRDLAMKDNVTVLFATHDYRLLEKFPARIFRCEKKRLTEISLSEFYP